MYNGKAPQRYHHPALPESQLQKESATMKPETLPKYRPYRHWPDDQLDAFIETTSTDYLDAMYAEFEREYRAAERTAQLAEAYSQPRATYSHIDAAVAAELDDDPFGDDKEWRQLDVPESEWRRIQRTS